MKGWHYSVECEQSKFRISNKTLLKPKTSTERPLSHLEQLISSLDSRDASIGIIGLGYVGLPLLLRYAEAGYRVTGFDVDLEKTIKLEKCQSYIKHIPSSALAIVKDRFNATIEFSHAKEMDALIICVPTPLGSHREPDMSYVIKTIESLLPNIKAGQIISLESTTYPGTTEEELLPRIESTGLKVGQDVALVYSPEREDPGNKHFSTQTIPKIVGGVTPTCLECGQSLYRYIIDTVVPVSSTRAAEATKLLENIHRAVNIGLVNEMKMVTDKMSLDIYEIIRAAATKPFGFVPYYPGPGLGGHCIPIDPFYLAWKAREYGINPRFIELAGEVNSNMPGWVVGKVVEAMNEMCKPLNQSKILVVGIAYKKNVDDMRESPAVEIMEILRSKGAIVSYSDPHVPVFPKMRGHEFNISSTPITADNLPNFDCVVVATDHDEFDYDTIQKHSLLIVDSRGVFRGCHKNVVSA